MIRQETLGGRWDLAGPKDSEQRLRAAVTNRFAQRTDRNELFDDAAHPAAEAGLAYLAADAMKMAGEADGGPGR